MSLTLSCVTENTIKKYMLRQILLIFFLRNEPKIWNKTTSVYFPLTFQWLKDFIIDRGPKGFAMICSNHWPQCTSLYSAFSEMFGDQSNDSRLSHIKHENEYFKSSLVCLVISYEKVKNDQMSWSTLVRTRDYGSIFLYTWGTPSPN